jgi:hypothetical protein
MTQTAMIVSLQLECNKFLSHEYLVLSFLHFAHTCIIVSPIAVKPDDRLGGDRLPNCLESLHQRIIILPSALFFT